MTFRFTGTGTSVGVPQIGCSCKVCTSADPRDRRNRCGAYVTAADGTSFLIDTPPEMRLACLAYGIGKVDSVVLTHAHMDHVAGFDDVRRFNTINGNTCMTCHAMAETVEQMHGIFPYVGKDGSADGLFRPKIEFDSSDAFVLGSVNISRLRIEHGFPCCGYLMEESGRRIAYLSDCHVIPDETIEAVRGVDVMVLDCLREREHPTHLTLGRAMRYLERIQPGRAYLIHMCHDFTHEEWLSKLVGTNVEPAYDGLEISCQQ